MLYMTHNFLSTSLVCLNICDLSDQFFFASYLVVFKVIWALQHVLLKLANNGNNNNGIDNEC